MGVEYKLVPINQLKLDIENPRIKQYIEMYGKNISSEGISLALSGGGTSDNRSSYQALRESIKVYRGIINPIIVNQREDGELIVIEGNTRLQIYREFHEADPQGPWNKIMCIVYKDMDAMQIHAIRLQIHLVGPREWDPYSKAKYLYQLSEKDHIPMAQIISYCGGKTRDVQIFISAYKDMQTYYVPEALSRGMDPDPREFSKFAELQNGSIKKALLKSKFTKLDFAKWVINRNIDNAQNVRKLPEVLNDNVAREEFLKSNITEAMKHISANEKRNKVLDSVPFDELVLELTDRIAHIEYKDAENLRSNVIYESQKQHLSSLQDELEELMQVIQK